MEERKINKQQRKTGEIGAEKKNFGKVLCCVANPDPQTGFFKFLKSEESTFFEVLNLDPQHEFVQLIVLYTFMK